MSRCTFTSSNVSVPIKKYRLAKAYQGADFFQGWGFGEHDWTGGASQYVNRETATAEKIVQAHNTHAIVRVGGRGDFLKRKSVRLTTEDSWMYGIFAMRFTHVPYGCGVWPAFWINSGLGHWPDGGELDILEYCNFGESVISFHTGGNKRCALEPTVVQDCDNFETLRVGYDCFTDYKVGMLGCGPAKPQSRMNGQEWSANPGVLAAEWTESAMKVFFFPDKEVPVDLEGKSPQPETWSAKHMIAYFPFAASEAAFPGLCPAPAELLEPQSIVLNIALCGDWASQTFAQSCLSSERPIESSDGSGRCVSVPSGTYSPLYKRDCCMNYVYDANRTYGADVSLETAYFNITWLKVFQRGGIESELLPPSPPSPPSPPPSTAPPPPWWAPPADAPLPVHKGFPWDAVAGVELILIVAIAVAKYFSLSPRTIVSNAARSLRAAVSPTVNSNATHADGADTKDSDKRPYTLITA